MCFANHLLKRTIVEIYSKNAKMQKIDLVYSNTCIVVK